DRLSVAALDLEPDACVLELALGDDRADAVGDQLARARCAAVPRAAACLEAVPDDLTEVADRLRERAADGAYMPDRIGLAFPAVSVCLAWETFEMQHRCAPSRAIASGTHSGDRLDRAGPLWSRHHLVAHRSGAVEQ